MDATFLRREAEQAAGEGSCVSVALTRVLMLGLQGSLAAGDLPIDLNVALLVHRDLVHHQISRREHVHGYSHPPVRSASNARS